MSTPKLELVIEGSIPAKDLTILAGRPKVGKTRLAVAAVAAILKGDKFLNYPAPTEPPKVILITDDQGDANTYEMLNALGIYEHPNSLWSRRFRVTERQLDQYKI